MIDELIEQAAREGVTVELTDSSVKVRGDHAAIEKWVPVLRPRKTELIEALRARVRPIRQPEPARAVEDVLKGRAVLVVLDGSGDRCWLVADAEDAAALGDVGDDAVSTRGEIRILAAIEDADVLADVMAFKRELKGRFTARR